MNRVMMREATLAGDGFHDRNAAFVREAVVGLSDLQQARTTVGPAAASAARAAPKPIIGASE